MGSQLEEDERKFPNDAVIIASRAMGLKTNLGFLGEIF